MKIAKHEHDDYLALMDYLAEYPGMSLGEHRERLTAELRFHENKMADTAALAPDDWWSEQAHYFHQFKASELNPMVPLLDKLIEEQGTDYLVLLAPDGWPKLMDLLDRKHFNARKTT